MNQNTYILIGLCIFFLLLGNRLKKYFGKKKEEKQEPIKKNQRSKVARKEYPTGRYRNRERVKRIFTYIVIVVLVLLIFFMIPALTKDIMMIGENGFSQNLFLRLLIFVLACVTVVSAYVKVRKMKKK